MRPIIAAKLLLPEAESLLVAITDTAKLSEAQYVASLIRADSTAARIAATAATLGDPHRYDAAIASYHGDYDDNDAYRIARGKALALLGRIYLARGRFVDARRVGLEAKRLVRGGTDPMLLTDVALQQGDTIAAVRELAFCRVATAYASTLARDSAVARQLLRLYRAINRGQVMGLDTVLTQALRDPALDYPVPIVPWHEPNARDQPAPDHFALLQYYTWVHCGRCSSHDAGAEALARRYNGQVILLSYQYSLPLSFPKSCFPLYGDYNLCARHLLHAGVANSTDRNSNGPCDWWVDGACMHMTSIGYGRAGGLAYYDQTIPFIEHRLTRRSPAHLTIQAVLRNGRVYTTARVTTVLSNSTWVRHRQKLHVVLVEDSLLIYGGNSPIQNHVVRAVVGDSATGFGTLLPLNEIVHTVRDTFDIPALEGAYRRKVKLLHEDDFYKDDRASWNDRVYHFDRKQLSVVAYLQDQITGEVLQAVQIRLSAN